MGDQKYTSMLDPFPNVPTPSIAELPSYDNYALDVVWVDDEQPASHSVHSSPMSTNDNKVQAREQSPSSYPDTGPLPLTLSNSIIFPSVPPSTALYSLLFSLDSRGDKNMLRRSGHGSVGAITDNDLYEITRGLVGSSKHSITFTLQGKRRSTYPGIGVVKLKSSFLGKYWECTIKDEVMLRSKDSEWLDPTGRVIAREQRAVVMSRAEKNVRFHGISVVTLEILISEGVNDRLRDLMVAVWVAKEWYAETSSSYNAKTTIDDVHRRIQLGDRSME